MNLISRTITGIILILAGLVLLVLAFLNPFKSAGFFVPLIYGLILFIVGFFILFNKREDKIEEIKKIKSRRR